MNLQSTEITKILVTDYFKDHNLSEDAFVVDFLDRMRADEADLQKRRLELEEKTISSNHEISLRKLDIEERLHKEKEITTRSGLIAIISIIVAAFVYSGLTRDTALSDKVINTVFGALGGLGAGAVVFQQKDKDKP